LEWTLIIQDKEHPEHLRVLLLSRTEAEEFKKLLHDEPAGSFALFSPRLAAMNYGDGIYVEGSSKLNREALFSSQSAQLTEFEKIIVQAKFAMGETMLYSQKEQAYLKDWLSASTQEMQDLAIQGFLPGSFQKFEKSILHNVFKELTAPTQERAEPIGLPSSSSASSSSSSSSSSASSTSLSSSSSSSSSAASNSSMSTSTTGQIPLALLQAKPRKIKLVYGERPTREERAQEKTAFIEWMLSCWTASEQDKAWMSVHLQKMDRFNILELADNANFIERLEKLLADKENYTKYQIVISDIWY
jgi:hypothetical protein